MSNPEGVPSATNSTPYATRPLWTIAFHAPGETGTYTIGCLREQEARSRFAAANPNAVIDSITFAEVPY